MKRMPSECSRRVVGGLRARLIVALAGLLLAGCVSDAPEEQTQTPPDSGQQLLQRGVQAYERGDYEAAATDFTQALSYYRSYDLADGIVRSRINLARIELDMGRPEIARDHLAAARNAAARSTGVDFTARLDLLESTAALELSELDRAAKRIKPHLPAFTPANQPASDDGPLSRQRLSFITNRTALAFARDDDDRSGWVERLDNALATHDTPPAGLEGRLHRFRAQVAADRGRREEALEHLEIALERYKRARHRPGIAATLEATAELHAEAGDEQTARDHLDRAFYLHIAMQNASGARGNLEKRLEWTQATPSRTKRLETWVERLESPQEIDWASLRDDVID